MKLDKWLLLFLVSWVFVTCRGNEKGEERVPRLPRWLKVFSKGPHPDDDTYEGREVFNHVDNVLQGGTIGVEVNMKKHVGRLNKWWEKVKRYMPALRRFKKRPAYREVEEFHPPAIDPRRKPNKLSSDRIRADP